MSILAIENVVDQITEKRLLPSAKDWPLVVGPPVIDDEAIGWIGPDGTIYDVGGTSHERWAREAIDRKLPGAENIEQIEFEAEAGLKDAGWIRFGYYEEEKGRLFFAELDTTNHEAVALAKRVLRELPFPPNHIIIDDYQTGSHYMGSPRPWLLGGGGKGPLSIVQRFHETTIDKSAIAKSPNIHEIRPGEIGPGESGWIDPDGVVYDIGSLTHSPAYGVLTNQVDKYGEDTVLPYSVYEAGWVRWYTQMTFPMALVLEMEYAKTGEWNAQELVRWNKSRIALVEVDVLFPGTYDNWEGTPDDFLGESLDEAPLLVPYKCAWWKDGVTHLGRYHADIATDFIEGIRGRNLRSIEIMATAYAMGWLRLDYAVRKQLLYVSVGGDTNVGEQEAIDIAFDFERASGSKVKAVDVRKHGFSVGRYTVGESLIEATAPEDIRVLPIDEITPTTIGWISREGKLYVSDEGTKYYSIGSSHNTIA